MGEFGKNLDLTLAEIGLARALQLFPHADDLTVIKLLLLALHVSIAHFLQLVRQVF